MKKALIALKEITDKIFVHKGFETVCVFLLYFMIYFCMMDRLPILADEVEWISSSGFYESFVQFHFEDPIWVEHRWTLTQPPLPRYLIGLGRNLGGFPISSLNVPSDYHIPDSISVFFPPEISSDVLWWSRLPMVVIASLGFTILFVMLRKNLGGIFGWIFVFFTCGNQYLQNQLARAMSESLLFFFVAVSLWVASLVLNSNGIKQESKTPSDSTPHYASWLLLGLLAGLAASAKISGIALIGFDVCILSFYILRSHFRANIMIIFSKFIRSISLLVFSSLFIFVALNPFLYPDPINRSVKLYKYRAAEMAWQQSHFVESSMPENIFDRSKIVTTQLFSNFGVFHFPLAWVLNFLLFLIGLNYALKEAWQWRYGSSKATVSLIFLLVSIWLAVPALFTPLDWERYYLLPVIMVTIFSGIGAAMIVERLLLCNRPLSNVDHGSA